MMEPALARIDPGHRPLVFWLDLTEEKGSYNSIIWLNETAPHLIVFSTPLPIHRGVQFLVAWRRVSAP